jgi:hypothetical protein
MGCDRLADLVDRVHQSGRGFAVDDCDVCDLGVGLQFRHHDLWRENHIFGQLFHQVRKPVDLGNCGHARAVCTIGEYVELMWRFRHHTAQHTLHPICAAALHDDQLVVFGLYTCDLEQSLRHPLDDVAMES